MRQSSECSIAKMVTCHAHKKVTFASNSDFAHVYDIAHKSVLNVLQYSPKTEVLPLCLTVHIFTIPETTCMMFGKVHGYS